jgi:hypothetical protein
MLPAEATCLNANWFMSLDEARACEAWRRDKGAGRNSEGTCADRDMRIGHSDDVKQQGHRENGTTAPDKPQ